MKIINNELYSRKDFPEYKYRVMLELSIHDEFHPFSLTIYTTEKSRDMIYESVLTLVTKKVDNFRIVHLATKEQDDMATKFINEWLIEDE